MNKEIKVNESKAEKFQRLAPYRVNAVLKALRILGNCAGGAYEYTQEQVEAIENALHVELADTMAKFKKVEDKKFEFKF